MKTFYRDTSKDAKIFGVLSGMIKSYDLKIEISTLRLITIIFAIFTNVPLLLTYVILFLVLPDKLFDTFDSNVCQDCNCGCERGECSCEDCDCDCKV